MRDCGTLWIMSEDASVENKVFRTNFNQLVYTSKTFVVVFQLDENTANVSGTGGTCLAWWPVNPDVCFSQIFFQKKLFFLV